MNFLNLQLDSHFLPPAKLFAVINSLAINLNFFLNQTVLPSAELPAIDGRQYMDFMVVGRAARGRHA
jgi:hypothetical protein